jgi:hypothetical protein
MQNSNWRTAVQILEGISERAAQYRDVPALLREWVGLAGHEGCAPARPALPLP